MSLLSLSDNISSVWIPNRNLSSQFVTLSLRLVKAIEIEMYIKKYFLKIEIKMSRGLRLKHFLVWFLVKLK